MDTKQTLLIVDDERININLLIDFLDSDYHLLVAKNGQQALQRAAGTITPNLILLDIMMPDMDGYEVCRRLKSNPKTQHIPVIFVTALIHEHDESAGFSVGAVDYISKPISPVLLRARIETQLSLQQLLKDQFVINESLKEANQIKNRFVGMAAHDLRTPLTFIKGLTELILQTEFDKETQRSFLQRIQKSSDRMLFLINDLLDITTIDDGEFSINLQPENFTDLVQERVPFYQHQAKQKDILLTFTSTPLADSYFDAIRITQVFDNLISNAIKFCQSGDQIDITLGQKNQSLFCCIDDQGPGMNEEDLGKMFNAFEKLANKPTAGESSTGLGLSIVKKIIDAHQGRIDVSSTLGEGSRFCFYIPEKIELERSNE